VTLSWFVTGYSSEFGFFNTQLALIIIFAAVIVFLDSRHRPAQSLALLAVAATLLLATWSPLVVLPGALGAFVIARSFRALVSTRGTTLIWLAVAFAQLVAYALVVVLPGLLANGGALAVSGGEIAFPRVMLPASCLVVIALAVLASRWARAEVVQTTIALALGSVVGLAVLLLAAKGQWTYYPHKYAWMATAVLVVAAAGLLFPALNRLRLRRWLSVVGVAVVMASLVTFILAAPQISTGERRLHPFARILEGKVWGAGDDVANRLFALADPRQPRLLWKSGDPHEGSIDFWLLQMQVKSIADGFDLRRAAYNIGFETTTSQLCTDLGLIGHRVEILTADRDLAAGLRGQCPETDAIVGLSPAAN
jgi:hypothetical protein